MTGQSDSAYDGSGGSSARVDSEVGRLRTVLLHRPGPGAASGSPRATTTRCSSTASRGWAGPRTSTTPSPQALRDRGVEVLYLADLLAETLVEAGRRAPTPSRPCCATRGSATRCADGRRPPARTWTRPTSPTVLIAGLRPRGAARRRSGGLVYRLMDRHDFVIDPLPNLLFTRDSVVWIARPGRRSPAWPCRPGCAGDHPDRGDLPPPPAVRRHRAGLRPGPRAPRGRRRAAAGPGVLAVGVGERTTPAGVERLARHVFAAGLAHTVLVVPIAQERATMHLDTVCTMVDVDAVVMYPNIADSLEAFTAVDRADGEPQVDRPGAVPGGRRQGDGHRPAAGDRHRARPGHRRAGAVGRRQQHPRDRAPAGGRPTSATSRPTPGWRRPASR